MRLETMRYDKIIAITAITNHAIIDKLNLWIRN